MRWILPLTLVSLLTCLPAFAQQRRASWVEVYQSDSGDHYLVDTNFIVYPKNQIAIKTLTQYGTPNSEGVVLRLSSMRFDCFNKLFGVENTTTFGINNQVILHTDNTDVEWTAVTPNSLSLAIYDSICPLLRKN
ncbi:hypothetical protein FACHB389_30245 [Nostoc calcicola FACHB-389]|nr:hypothetical protein [Nostoc calcicola FACHB-3891]OKH23893.1 hypothetical protein FACHB389_30245 [Nostoc calcicola FACHB-389]